MNNDDKHKRYLRTRRDENVGTVLFDTSNIEKECWSNEELALLNSRIIFQDILPQVRNVDSLFEVAVTI